MGNKRLIKQMKNEAEERLIKSRELLERNLILERFITRLAISEGKMGGQMIADAQRNTQNARNMIITDEKLVAFLNEIYEEN